MKLAEAILERDALNQRLELLGLRLREDMEKGGVVSRLLEDLQHTANRLRDLDVAISWTKHQVAIVGINLTAYEIRQKNFARLASIMEKIDREKADNLVEASQNDNRVLQNAYWIADLQVPVMEEAPETESNTKEE